VRIVANQRGYPSSASPRYKNDFSVVIASEGRTGSKDQITEKNAEKEQQKGKDEQKQ